AKAPPLRLPQTVDREAAKRALADTHAWLMVEQVEAGVERPLAVRVSTKELIELELGVCEGCAEEPQALRVGLTKAVKARGSFLSPSWGEVKSTYDAGRVWSAAVRSEGAFGLRLHFKRFRLPADTELYLFNERGEVAGPYSGWGPLGTGEFWANMITGDTVYLQLRQYGPAGPEKVGAAWFDLTDVGHVAEGFGRSLQAMAKAFCTYNASCVENVNCGSPSLAVDVARDAVAHMQFVKRPYLYVCSGGLIADSAGSGTPYFLTANHCISRDREASTLETYFQWTVGCGKTCPTQWEEPIDTPKMLGSSVVATNNTGDYTLLLLNGSVPEGLAFLGWTSEPVAFANGTDLYRVSHPSAAPQAYSEHQVDTLAGTCTTWPRGSWIYSRDTSGATEGGSSGSPVVNGAGLVVGQLSGACGTNVNDNCDATNNATVDGAFAGYYTEVAQYLGGSGCVPTPEDCSNGVDDDCDGLVDDDDPDCQTCVPTAEDCSNGLDDDCDGLVDGEDPDCDTTCGLPGDTCSTGADCCSGRCHPRKLVCQ
ncbi:MAG TPA: serine protease, partial [Candidatus Sulfomarinibacteraceae bacterium]|nr:serine protease [Candidatus Sulfomarinibacteraceae bacterium]